jgi:hypothetical protein
MHKSPTAASSIAVFLAVASVTSITAGASAETIEVPGDFPTIQGAIESAESGDVVQVAAGLFPIRSAIDPMGKAIEIRGTSDSEGRPITRIDGGSATRLLDVDSLETNATIFRNLVFENGGVTSFGSVVRITNASPVFETCEFRGGYAIYKAGGVLTRQSAAPIFRDCLFAENQSEIVGGAIFADDSSSFTLEGCEIRDNLAQSGAGIYINGSATARIQDSNVCDNETPQVDGAFEDLGGNTIADTCRCDGDLDGDGMVSGVDLGLFFSFWGPCPAPCPADQNNDGVVNGTDLGAFFALWGPCP